MEANMKLTTQLFPDNIFSDISLTFRKIHDISLTAVKFPRHFQVFHTSGQPDAITRRQP